MKRKRQKSPNSEIASTTTRQKTKKRAKSPSSDQKEDGEISDDIDSDDDDDDDDSSRDRENSPVFQRKEIVYEIDDDSYGSSSDASGRNSPYNNFSGENVVTNQIEK